MCFRSLSVCSVLVVQYIGIVWDNKVTSRSVEVFNLLTGVSIRMFSVGSCDVFLSSKLTYDAMDRKTTDASINNNVGWSQKKLVHF